MTRNRAALLASVALLTAATIATTKPAAAPWESIDLGGLPEIRSVDGILRATLTVAPATVSTGTASFPGAIYNGDYAGPVLRVRPGDQVHIRLINHLPDATNLHFHGLRISPLGRGDNMHVTVPPGAARDYLFRIPANHPPGLFWYHDHMHGFATAHVNAGLSGAILIDGFTRAFTGLDSVAQKLLVLKDYTAADCQGPPLKTELHCRVVSINGREVWRATLHPGETQLWRLSNQGANLALHLTLPGMVLRVIGRDGTPTAAPMPVAALDVLPASRLDALVTAGAPGTVALAAQNVLTGVASHFSASRVLGEITIAGPPAPPPPGIGFPQQVDLRTLTLSARRIVTFTEDQDAGRYFIDGRLFDHSRLDLRVPLGSVEEWTIRNKTEDFHEFHIHQLGFQVAEINGVKQDFAGYVDTVKVPEMGEVKLILPFTDPTMVGAFMYHCHVLKHEDGGMMANIEVYGTGDSVPSHICLAPPEDEATLQN